MHDTPAFDQPRSGAEEMRFVTQTHHRDSDKRRISSEFENDAATAHFGTQRVSKLVDSEKRTPSRKTVAQSSITIKEVQPAEEFLGSLQDTQTLGQLSMDRGP